MSTHMRYLDHLTCVFVISALGATARADEAATAKQHSDEGTKLFNVQRYDNAAEEYRTAYLLDPRPEYLYAIAQSERLAGDCTRALQSYQAYLRADPPPDERAKAEMNIERCRQQVQQREAAAQSSELETAAAPPAPPPPAEPSRAPRPLPPARSYLAGHLLVGVGAAALGVGGYFYRKGHGAIQAHNDASSYEDFLATDKGLGDARWKQTLGVSAFAAGGGLIISGIVYYVFRARMPVETNVSAQVTPGSTTLTLSRSF